MGQARELLRLVSRFKLTHYHGSMPLTAGHALKQHAYGGLTLRRLAPAARPVRRGGDENLDPTLCLSYGDPPSYSHVDGTYLSKEEVVLVLAP